MYKVHTLLQNNEIPSKLHNIKLKNAKKDFYFLNLLEHRLQ